MEGAYGGGFGMRQQNQLCQRPNSNYGSILLGFQDMTMGPTMERLGQPLYYLTLDSGQQ